MARGGPSLIASVLLHAGVAALALVSWPSERETPRELLATVPVSIVSEMTVSAAAPDNPSDELVEEDGSSSPEAPAEVPPEPVPEPVPTPPQPRPEPPRKAEPRPEPPQRADPPRKADPPRQPPQRREEPGLNLDELSERPRTGTTTGRTSTGDRGTGAAPRALGQADLQSIAAQITPHWNPPCHLPGIEGVSLSVEVRMSEDGRLVGDPRLRNPRSDATWRAAADSIMRAIRIPPRYRMPPNYQEQSFIITFPLAQACGNR